MELEFLTIRGKPVSPPHSNEGRITFVASKPLIIQPSEIMKVQTDLLVRVPAGYILSISTHPEMAKRVGELFPGLIVVGEEKEPYPLELAIRNSGRNLLSVMVGQPLALACLSELQNPWISMAEMDKAGAPDMVRTGPQKKNPDFRFELKGPTNG